ncbi:hypothetical protein G6514_006629 [Epicoccum nigrum]|nr:hypothetical protein G6514_006629 [Epicoccum nigrum]
MSASPGLGLGPWLHDQIQTHLALGHSWLEEKLKAKAKASSGRQLATVDSKWQGIYHDNGSCIDIIGPLSPLSPPQGKVLVLQTDPLLITDGHHHVPASLSAACRDHLRIRYSLDPRPNIHAGTLCIVNKYTIRYTSYGPPRNRFRLFLDDIDCVGEDHTTNLCADPQGALVGSDEIRATLLLLDHTRELDDARCLPPQATKEEEPDEASYTMAGADDTLDEQASMNTQIPFATQLQHPMRARSKDEEVTFLGTKPLEPVLAGNTQRAELRYASASSAAQSKQEAQRNKLLAMLKRNPSPPPPLPAQSPARSHGNITPDLSKSRHHPATCSPRLRETPSKRSNPEAIPPQTPTNKGRKRARESELRSPSTQQSTKRTSFSKDEPEQSRVTELDKFAAECPWMKGLKLNRAAFTVPADQDNILQKPESWYKPQPGNRFPEPNIPIKTFLALSRLADEQAALEGATSSGSFNQPDPSSGSYPPASAPQPADEQSSDSEGDVPTDTVSWQTSPSPQPPQRPTMPRQDLPPDSSHEMPIDDEEAAASQVAGRNAKPPNSTLPHSSHEGNVELPPSSPPVAHAVDDFDDEMELEASIPQALGEDLDAQPTGRSHPSPKPRAAPEPSSVLKAKETSVVQVKETPNVKGKNGQQPVVTISPPTQRSYDTLGHSSSTSIVRGTYQDLQFSAVEETKLDILQPDNSTNQKDAVGSQSQINAKQARISPERNARDTSMITASVREEHPIAIRTGVETPFGEVHATTAQQADMLQLEPTPMSAQVPPKDSSSGEQPVAIPSEKSSKRRRDTKPRLSPRKRFKVPGLKDFEQRSTSIESKPSTTDGEPQHVEIKVEVVGVKETTKAQSEEAIFSAVGSMSPRHLSLYEDPSPVQRSAEGPSNNTSATKLNNLTGLKQKSPAVEATEDHIERTAEMQLKQMQHPPKTLSERPQSEPTDESEPVSMAAPPAAEVIKVQPRSSSVRSQAPLEPDPAANPLTETGELTMFAKFKAAYPEYTGSIKVFTRLCNTINNLDLEDKMVSKWMWDDFIIRNRTDYKPYVEECTEEGEDPLPYLHFYKDRLQGAKYQKGVINTRAALLQALEGLGVQPQTAMPPLPQLPVQHVVDQTHGVSTPSAPENVHQSPERPRQPTGQRVNFSSQQAIRAQKRPSMPLPSQITETPAKKKPSRKSEPFQVPSSSASGLASSTARGRHSLGASSSRAPTTVPSASARQSASTQPKPQSALGDRLREFAKQNPRPKPTGNPYIDYFNSTPKTTSFTGSRRVSQTPASTSVEEKDKAGNVEGKR